MKLSGPTKLLFEVDPHAFINAPHDRKSLNYLLERLFSGEETAVKELESWGITVELVDEFIAIPRMD